MPKTQITHIELYFIINGEMTFEINEEEPEFKTEAWEGSVYRYNQLLEQLKEGDLKEQVQKTYDKFRKLRKIIDRN